MKEKPKYLRVACMEDTNSCEVLLARERVARQICSDLNNFVDLQSTLITIINHLKNLTSCEAVAIRLQGDGDYPYYVYNGFPESFIKRESRLCSKSNEGNRIVLPDGSGYQLDCMCGNVIHGRVDPALPFFTEDGSFWSNHTTALLAGTNAEDRQAETRNYCNSCGYESVALVPIKAQGERIGLVQFNDHRQGMFTKSLIEYLEMISVNIGLAVRNSRIYTKLKEALDEIKTLQGILPICAYCKKIRNDGGYWKQVEEYISDHTDAKFSHGICPACFEKEMKELKA